MYTPNYGPVYMLFWVFNRVFAPGWLVLQMGQLIGRKGECLIRLPLSRAEFNVDNDLVPEARNVGQAPPDPCSGVRAL